MTQHQHPIVAHVHSATERGLVDDVRAAKASMLYSDQVILTSSRLCTMAMRPEWWGLEGEQQLGLMSALKDALNIQRPDDSEPTGAEVYEGSLDAEWVALLDLTKGWTEGHLRILDQEATIQSSLLLMLDAWDPKLGIPVLDERSLDRMDGFREHTLAKRVPQLLSNSPRATSTNSVRAEGLLVRELLGTLPAFPSASWDEISDVRDRLANSRTRFRAAIMTAATELAEVPLNELHTAAAHYRSRTVQPALADIDDALQELRVVPTLLRVATDKAALGAGAAALAIVASSVTGIADASLLQPLLGAGASAAAIREVDSRRKIKKHVAGPAFLASPSTRARRRRLQKYAQTQAVAPLAVAND